MKSVFAIAVLASLAATAHAQLSTIPPSSTTDGIFIQPGQATWAGSALGAYSFASDDNLGTPNMHSPDNVLGLSWSNSVNPAITSALSQINIDGGTIRAIFVGESAGWKNDFGYSYTGQPISPASFSLFTNIQAAGATPNISFGQYADISLNPGQASTFDFWLDGVGNAGNPGQFGGVYTPIHQMNSAPYENPGNALWSTSALKVNTWVQSANNGAGGVEAVSTYLVGFEDWQLNNGADKDYNDFAFALQVFDKNGVPFGSPVPEPSTYGLIGGVALLGLVARRRFFAKK